MGSFAYGVSSDTSDVDIYGMYIPPIEQIFPHIAGYIPGFGQAPQKVDTYQKHHIELKDEGKEYDVALTSIVKYFALCMDNNPNMIDSLFVPARCIVHMSDVGSIMRENRRMFLHKGIQKRLQGYAYSQMKKLHTKKPDTDSKRYETVQEHGYDVKFAYHVVRLIQQAEMVLTTGDLVLDEDGNRELMKAVRRGEWTLEELEEWFKRRTAELETLYIDSDLQYSPNESKLKELLYQCIEAHHGSLSNYFNLEGSERVAQEKLKQIKDILDK
jgi:predicted nucleotidyltransferase